MKHCQFVKNMDEKLQSKIRKLFETRLNLETELLKGHSLLLEYIENNSHTTKIDNAVYKCAFIFLVHTCYHHRLLFLYRS